ncbi:carbohydrate ABC transporter permease [Mesorhizobium sp. LjRoot246]|uniref:carbohydrate ABC transporter permease n=1 Tax=Mesorhizobium sp. LjRoot246 TaxID=3342294 RepID=UPI003ED13880
MSSTLFSGRWTALALMAPLLLLIMIFFYLPVIDAFYWSFFLERPFGGANFVGLNNFTRVLSDPAFWESLRKTVVFMVVASTLAVLVPLVLALAADRHIRLSYPARNVLVWPKAVAGASIGVVFNFIFNPFVGILMPLNHWFPGIWNPGINGTDAFIMLVAAHVWGGIPFNFVILLAGLLAIPAPLQQAAAMDGAGPWRRIFDIQLPLITPQIFLTLVLEFTDSVVSAFSLVDTMTKGGPGGATTLLVYKIYVDGFLGFDLSGAATQTVLLMIFMLAVTAFHFLYLERRVQYER